MRIGDLVTWSGFYECWMLTVGWSRNVLVERGLTGRDKCGIIVDENEKYYFVLWEDNTRIAHEPRDLELISEAR